MSLMRAVIPFWPPPEVTAEWIPLVADIGCTLSEALQEIHNIVAVEFFPYL